uniref:Uncharacterized protein n=1 Tax=viral metagenome TaxID=1070528 RepID=A0A6M3X4C0_9ZZZZ
MWELKVNESVRSVVGGLFGLNVHQMALVKGAKSVLNLWKKGGNHDTVCGGIQS